MAADKAAAAAGGTPSFAQPLNRTARDAKKATAATAVEDDEDDVTGGIGMSSVLSFLDESKMTPEQKVEVRHTMVHGAPCVSVWAGRGMHGRWARACRRGRSTWHMCSW